MAGGSCVGSDDRNGMVEREEDGDGISWGFHLSWFKPMARPARGVEKKCLSLHLHLAGTAFQRTELYCVQVYSCIITTNKNWIGLHIFSPTIVKVAAVGRGLDAWGRDYTNPFVGPSSTYLLSCSASSASVKSLF